MQGEYWENTQCEVCFKLLRPSYPLLRFNYLEGSPVICEPCVFKILTGKERKLLKTLRKYYD